MNKNMQKWRYGIFEHWR